MRDLLFLGFGRFGGTKKHIAENCRVAEAPSLCFEWDAANSIRQHCRVDLHVGVHSGRLLALSAAEGSGGRRACIARRRVARARRRATCAPDCDPNFSSYFMSRDHASRIALRAERDSRTEKVQD